MMNKDERRVFLDIRRAVQQREGASILLLPLANWIHLSSPSFECKEFLYEFKDLDLPNEIRIMASFVLVQFSTLGSGEPITKV
jgi:hypothetical protein